MYNSWDSIISLITTYFWGDILKIYSIFIKFVSIICQPNGENVSEFYCKYYINSDPVEELDSHRCVERQDIQGKKEEFWTA